MEIPVQFQKTVTVVYYVFLMYVLALCVNVIASLFYMIFAGGKRKRFSSVYFTTFLLFSEIKDR